MSKRARITLNPETNAASAKPDTAVPDSDESLRVAGSNKEATQGPAVGARSKAPSATAREKTLDTSTVIKVVLVGLAVAAVVLLLKGRKP